MILKFTCYVGLACVLLSALQGTYCFYFTDSKEHDYPRIGRRNQIVSTKAHFDFENKGLVNSNIQLPGSSDVIFANKNIEALLQRLSVPMVSYSDASRLSDAWLRRRRSLLSYQKSQ